MHCAAFCCGREDRLDCKWVFGISGAPRQSRPHSFTKTDSSELTGPAALRPQPPTDDPQQRRRHGAERSQLKPCNTLISCVAFEDDGTSMRQRKSNKWAGARVKIHKLEAYNYNRSAFPCAVPTDDIHPSWKGFRNTRTPQRGGIPFSATEDFVRDTSEGHSCYSQRRPAKIRSKIGRLASLVSADCRVSAPAGVWRRSLNGCHRELEIWK